MKPAPDFREMSALLAKYKAEKARTLARLIDRGLPLRSLAGRTLRELRDLEDGPEAPTYPKAQAGLW